MTIFSGVNTTAPPQAVAAPLTSVASKQDVLRRNNVRVLGHGKPPMLLCNGFGYNQHMWHYVTTALAAHHQLILFDHVGSGDSELSAYDATRYSSLAGYAQDLVEICQALDVREAVLVGHSVGASIAMLAAITAPEHFKKVVLLTPSPCYINEPGYYGGFERENLVQVLEAMRSDYHGWALMFAELLLGPSFLPDTGEELARFFTATNAAIAQQFARVTFFSDNRADVPRLHLPTLVVLCRHDVVAPREVGEYLLAQLPQAQLVTLRASGHCPQLSAPLETLAALQAFAL